MSFDESVLILLANDITGSMSISLKVVSRAAVCWASTKRAAIVRRNMLRGLTSSARWAGPSVIRLDDAALLSWVWFEIAAAGGLLGAGAAGAGPRDRTNAKTSSFNRRPPGPVAGTCEAVRRCSSSSRWAAGMTKAGPEVVAATPVAATPVAARRCGSRRGGSRRRRAVPERWIRHRLLPWIRMRVDRRVESRR